jgi:O-antigen ligase
MGAILALFFVAAPIGLAVIAPVFLIYLSLLTGGLPLNFGRQEVLTNVFGRLDLPAIRLFGLWLAACLVVLTHLGQAWRYLVSFRFHLFFLVFCCIALLWSPSYVYGARMIAKLTAPFLLLLLIMLVISTSEQLKWMERLMFTSGLLVIALAVIARLTKANLDAMFTIPGLSAAVFTAHLVAISMLVLANLKQSSHPKDFILVGLFVAAIIAGFTRITIAALFVGFSIILFMAYRGLPSVILPASGLIGLPALFFLNDAYKSRMFIGANKITLQSALDNPTQMLGHVHGSGRFAAWNNVLHKFFDPNPLIGSGVGATQNYFYTYSVTGLGVIHSEYVRLLAEVGLLGLALFLMAAVVYLFRLVRIYLSTPDSNSGRYALAAMGGLIAYLIFMATDNAFDYVNAFGVYVFALIAMSEKAMEIEKGQKEKTFLEEDLSDFPDDFGPVPKGIGQKQVRKYPIIYQG